MPLSFTTPGTTVTVTGNRQSLPGARRRALPCGRPRLGTVSVAPVAVRWQPDCVKVSLPEHSVAIALAFIGALLPSLALAAIDPDTGRWRPGIGDPTVYGWVTVAAYLGTAALLLANRRLAARLGLADAFWPVAGLLMLALGINKQLDLQTWFTQVGRDLALAQGWYDDRRVMQAAFIAALTLGGVAITLCMRRLLRSAWDQYRLCAIGVVVTLVFVVVRAATFHHVDRMLGMDFAGLRVNVLLELGGIALVLIGAVLWRRRSRQRERWLTKAYSVR